MPVIAASESSGFVRAAPNILTQKLPAAAFTLDTRIELQGAAPGDRAGLILNGQSYAALGLRKQGGELQLVHTTCTPFKPRCAEQDTVLLSKTPNTLSLRMVMREGAQAQFLYSAGDAATASGAWLDVDHFRVTR